MLVEQTMHLMASTITVHLDVEESEASLAQQAVAASQEWFADVAARFTRFTAESELSRLNAGAGIWQDASEDLFTVVAESIVAAEASDGLFDPALLPLLEALGYDRDFASFAHRESRTAWRVAHGSATTGRWHEILLDAANRRIRLPEGCRLDLGGIVKGWSADAALERCFGDFANVLISVGGDMRARGGSEEGSVWPVGIGDSRLVPDDVPALHHAAVVTIGNGGLATSGATDRWWYRAGERQHHLIDPRTGRPAQVWIDHSDDREGTFPLIASATALAPTAAHAEIAAKVALLRGYPGALEAVEAAWKTRDITTPTPYRDADVALLLVLGTGKVEYSTNFQTYLTSLGGGGNLWIT